ncbi:MAG: tetratricopeptide repeat protein [Planctomycetes bacterium]|nr:tetratricopeptide repeat protein [Planctomycetota bacterium]
MKRGFIYPAIGLLLAYFLINSVGFSDEAMAKAFLAKGDEAMKQKKYDQALELYQKAVAEAPNLPEAYLKIGETYFKLNDLPKGRTALKKCITLIDETPKPSEDLVKLRKRADEMLVNSDVFRKGYRALRLEYAKELMAFVKKVQPKDNGLAESALKRVIAIEKNDEASKMLEDLRKNRIITTWTPLVNVSDMTRWFWYEPEEWVAENDELTCDTQGIACSVNGDGWGKDKYKVSVEFRVLKTYTPQYSAGLAIAWAKGYKSVVIQGEGTLALMSYGLSNAAGDSRKNEILKAEPLAGVLQKDDWNKLMVDVAGQNLKAYLNDKLIIDYKCADSLEGGIGLTGETGRFLFRNLKYIK